MRIRVWTLGMGLAAVALAGCGAPSGSGARAPTKDSTACPSQAGADASVAAPGALARADSAPTILFVGTSLTAGLGLDPDSAYPARIQRKLDSAGLAFHVVNAGVSGETSAGALRRMDWLLRQPVALLVLETGANDGLRGTPVSETRGNIQAIIDTVRRLQPAARIVLMQMEALPNLGPRYTQAFHETFPLLAQRNGLMLLPFPLAGVAGHAALVQPDGLHPNDEGERLVAENVWRALRPVLPLTHPGRTP